MRGLIYKVDVCDSAIDMVHGGGYQIIELYIPSEQISFNIANDNINCFPTEEIRYKKEDLIREIDIPEEFIEAIKKFVAARFELNKPAQWFKLQIMKDIIKMDQEAMEKYKIENAKTMETITTNINTALDLEHCKGSCECNTPVKKKKNRRTEFLALHLFPKKKP